MHRIYFTITLIWFSYIERTLQPSRRKDERGSVTFEYVLWAVALIAIVTGVVFVYNQFVAAESAKIR